MPSFNKTLLMGNLTRDPELRYTPGGAAVCEFGLAVNRKYKTQGGEDREEALFIEVVCWTRLAEVAAEYLSKGRPVFVEGYLKLDQWEAENGEKRSKIKVNAMTIQFLGSGEGQGGNGQQGTTTRGAGGGTVERSGGGGTVERGSGAAGTVERGSGAAEKPAEEKDKFDEFDLDSIPF